MLESSLILSWDYKNAILLRMEVSKQPAGRQRRRMSDTGVLVFAFIPIRRAGSPEVLFSPSRAVHQHTQSRTENQPRRKGRYA